MGDMALDEAFGRFKDRSAFQDVMDNGVKDAGDKDKAKTMADKMFALNKSMSDIIRRVADHGGDSEALHQAIETAEDVSGAAMELAHDFQLGEVGDVQADLDKLDKALDSGANYRWEDNDSDQGGISVSGTFDHLMNGMDDLVGSNSHQRNHDNEGTPYTKYPKDLPGAE